MDVGFETIGNATLIVHDAGPVLVTDPWLVGSAYFGSWTLSHEIPAEQLESAKACPFVWVSHGHPDHLSPESLALLSGSGERRVLVPNHFGGRIAEDLRALGFDVHVLVDRVWTPLSPRVRVMCIPDVNQDAVLLVDVDGTLLVNLNDASDRGWGRFVRNVIRGYSKSFLLSLSGYGDADMINFFTEDGERLPPHAAQRTPVGQTIARQAEHYGVKYFVPFSSMHRYQRKDSLWAGEYTTTLADHARGFTSTTAELLPAFIRYDVAREQLTELRPRENVIVPKEPSEFGDHWSDPLQAEEVMALERYFRSIQHLGESLDFVTFRVGGREHPIRFHGRRFGRGVTFEAPRASLMAAVRHEVFDDLLIGNFMKTTLHGDFGQRGLYPDFSPYVAKYADNGRAKDAAQVHNYMAEYRRRDPLGFLQYELESRYLLPAQETGANVLRKVLGPQSPTFRVAKEVYWEARKRLF
ncbi:MAG: MBL fold metallo-hydrolase [Myxococcaceae bacterium]|nr:MBL fold metallo-hydrolase [Myxococcaceae bacterium]MCI0671771.1 MBL fold metallo-hydrolase [Myxococcaceae bacterium]